MDITINTNLADSIISIINSLCEKLGIVFDWSKENVLPQLQRLAESFIKYRISFHWLFIVVPFLIVVILTILSIIGTKRRWDSDLRSFLSIFLGISIVVFIIVGSIQIVGLFRCYNFPELEIITYLKNLNLN